MADRAFEDFKRMNSKEQRHLLSKILQCAETEKHLQGELINKGYFCLDMMSLPTSASASSYAAASSSSSSSSSSGRKESSRQKGFSISKTLARHSSTAFAQNDGATSALRDLWKSFNQSDDFEELEERTLKDEGNESLRELALNYRKLSQCCLLILVLHRVMGYVRAVIEESRVAVHGIIDKGLESARKVSQPSGSSSSSSSSSSASFLPLQMPSSSSFVPILSPENTQSHLLTPDDFSIHGYPSGTVSRPEAEQLLGYPLSAPPNSSNGYSTNPFLDEISPPEYEHTYRGGNITELPSYSLTALENEDPFADQHAIDTSRYFFGDEGLVISEPKARPHSFAFFSNNRSSSSSNSNPSSPLTSSTSPTLSSPSSSSSSSTSRSRTASTRPLSSMPNVNAPLSSPSSTMVASPAGSNKNLAAVRKYSSAVEEKHLAFINGCVSLLTMLPSETALKPLFTEQLNNTTELSVAVNKFLRQLNIQSKPSLKKRMEEVLVGSKYSKFPWAGQRVQAPIPELERVQSDDLARARRLVNSTVRSSPTLHVQPRPVPETRLPWSHDLSELCYKPQVTFIPDNPLIPPVTIVGGRNVTLGRKIDDVPNENKSFLGFPSKVVSRIHAEVWFVSGAYYIRDLKSTSGTFLNAMRLSEPGKESKPFKIQSGDSLQLGVDYKKGTKSEEKCINLRLEILKIPHSLRHMCLLVVKNNWQIYPEALLSKLPHSLEREILDMN